MKQQMDGAHLDIFLFTLAVCLATFVENQSKYIISVSDQISEQHGEQNRSWRRPQKT